MTHLSGPTVIESLKKHNPTDVATRILELYYSRSLTNETFLGEGSDWLIILADEANYFPYDAAYRICVHLVRKIVEVDSLTVRRLEPTPVMEKLPPQKIYKKDKPPELP